MRLYKLKGKNWLEKGSFLLLPHSRRGLSNTAILASFRPGKIVRPMLFGGARMHKTSEARPSFLVRTFCFVKKKKIVDQ